MHGLAGLIFVLVSGWELAYTRNLSVETEAKNVPAPLPTIGRVRFKLLDGLRFFAAFAVIAYHYLGFDHSRWGVPPLELFPVLSPMAAYGALGVQLFFIISGFVILMSAQGRTVGEFVSSRISRLFPAYWFGVLATVFLYVVLAPGQFKTPSIEMVLANLTMVQEALGIPHIDGVYWTLWVELLFYVLICGLIAIKPSESRIVAFAFLWPLIGAVAQRSESDFLRMMLSPQYAPLFAGGMALYLIHAYGHSLSRWLLVVFNVCVASQQTVDNFLMTAMQKNTGQELSATVGVLVVVGFFVVVALVTVTPLKGLGPDWLTYVGALTFPIYLVHEAWGWWIISLVNPEHGKWAALLMAIVFSLAFAMIIERFIERPIRPMIGNALRSTSQVRYSGKRSSGRQVDLQSTP
ncbi:acyltransferase family protein [Paeniglutamicibacter sp. R2-26]|uniref:acyltransferase family protein n=1 Tax=Paeniglutamicibacter sp. R2-26 TaxID=3144417 RepID=UPI003EE52B15